MTDYVAAIDDSGGIEPLVKWGGTYVPGDHQIACITSLLLRRDLENEFNEMWLELRQEIQDHLACSHLPPVHMRLMYGRDKPPKYRGQPNPYLGCEFQKVVEWIIKGVQIIERFRVRPRGAYWNVIWDRRDDLASGILRYFSDPLLVAELEFLAAHGKRSARRSFAQKYLKKMASPLLPLLTRQILTLNEAMYQLRGKTVELQLDPFADASGMDAIEIIEAVRSVTAIPYVSKITVMQDADDVQLLQAADLIGYILFRRAMGGEKFIEEDRVLIRIMTENVNPKVRFVNANVDHIIRRRLAKQPNLGISIHFAVARSVIEKADPAFAEEHLLTVAEMNEAVKKVVPNRNGYSILKPQTLQAIQNGEDPS